MGQYHYLINLSKKQFVHPHQIGNGLKLREQIGHEFSTSTVLVMLLAASSGRGGGDFRSQHPLVGSWAGDKIAFIGDYVERNDIPGFNARTIIEKIYPDVPQNGWVNISDQVREMMSQEFEIRYEGSGWLKIRRKSDLD
jgi:hypothetical protein